MVQVTPHYWEEMDLQQEEGENSSLPGAEFGSMRSVINKITTRGGGRLEEQQME